MRTIAILLLTAATAALSSCSKKNLASGAINLPGNATVYVAGSLGDTAVYFVNGKKYALTSGKTPASANSIALSGPDIYTAGYESNGAHTVAKYWKNGTATALSDTTKNAIATGMAVVGSDVYVAGWIALGSTNAAAIWKNGALTLLTAAGHDGAATAIAVNGTDVYVSGYDSVAGNVTACYWKNGTINTLPDSIPYAQALGIAVSGSEVYVVGWDMNLNPSLPYYGKARLWHNGTAATLPATTFYSLATSITIAGNTVYIGGVDRYQTVYWENGAEKPISDGYWTSAIAVNNGDIYCAGISSSSGGGYNSAAFWRNGIGFILDANKSTANAIVVTN